MPSKEKIISDTLYVALDTFVIAIAGYLFWSFMGKTLSVFDYGVLTTTLTLYSFFSALFTLNIQEVFGKLIPQYIAMNKENKINDLIKYTAKLITVISTLGILSLLIIFYLKFFEIKFSESIFLCAILLIPGIFYNFLRAIFYGYSLFKKIFFIDLISHGIKPFLAIFLVVIGFTLGGIYAWFFTFIIASVLFFIFINKKFNQIEYENKKFFLENIKSSFIAFISIFLITNFGIIYIGYLDMESAGFWGALIIIGQILLLLPSIIQSAIFPSLSFFVKENSKNVEILLNKSLKYIIITLLPAALCFILFAKQIILLLYKNDYLFITNIIPIQVLSIILYALALINLSVIYSLGYQKIRNYIMFFTGFIALFINLFLISEFLVIGAAISFMITSLIFFILSFFIIKKLNIKLFLNLKKIIKFILVLFFFLICLYIITFTPLFFAIPLLFILLVCYLVILYKIKIVNETDILVLNIIIKKLKYKLCHIRTIKVRRKGLKNKKIIL
ncbi:MAG: polysaccharide biosynthesis C-terminal domain-containing protein [Candidatus Pacearchaeota archaeon]